MTAATPPRLSSGTSDSAKEVLKEVLLKSLAEDGPVDVPAGPDLARALGVEAGDTVTLECTPDQACGYLLQFRRTAD